LDQQAQLERTILQLNQQLRQLVGGNPEERVRLWADADLRVELAPSDEPEAIAIGLRERAELVLIRHLRDNLSATSVTVARSALAAADPSLGVSGSPAMSLFSQHLLCGCLACEEPIRARQLDRLLNSREEAVADDVREAIIAMETRLRQVAIANERLAHWRKRHDDLEALRQVGQTTPFDVNAAELEIIRAETTLVQQVIAWRIAQVDLREAQGLLD
jgi:outer membrane protein TolC